MRMQRLQFVRYLFVLFPIHDQYKFVTGNPVWGKDIKYAKDREFPFAVAIAMKGGAPREHRQFCGGVLVTKEHVITASHCFSGKLWGYIELILGSNDLNKGIRYLPRKWITFKQWAKDNNDERPSIGDIGIIMLSEKVKESYIKPANIMYENHDYWHTKSVNIAGWGKPSSNERSSIMLRTAVVEVITNKQCSLNICLTKMISLPIPEEYYCSQSKLHSFTGCGDSGGPIIYDKRNVFAIVKGICPNDDYDDIDERQLNDFRVNIHTSLEYYKNFIEHVTEHDTLANL